jgi:hypothetical protein
MTAEIRRRQLLSLVAASGLTACASPFWGTLASGIRKPQGPTITRAYADRLPYASLMGWFDKGSKALLVLGEYSESNRLTWYSAERQSLTTFGPFIVQALGTDIELRDSRLSNGWSRDLRELVGLSLERSSRFLARGDEVEVITRSTFAAGERVTINILGVNHTVRKFTESVAAEGRTRYTNSYWVDESNGRCWKSKQILAPTLPHFNIEVVKSPQNPAA